MLTPAQMAKADASAIAGGTPAEVLMERAGRSVARTALRMLGGGYGRRVAVVCGKGNNGGDGLVAARVLRRSGVRVELFELAEGIRRSDADRALGRSDLVIDAMYGTGFRGALEGDAAWLAERLHATGLRGGVERSARSAHRVPVLAVDIPSGVSGYTGAVEHVAVRATATVCLAALKIGVLLYPGAGYVGSLQVADIGIDLSPAGFSMWVAEASDVEEWLPARELETHKWKVGGVYVVAGSGGMTGAAMMTSHAAMRCGAGIVVCGLPGALAAGMASGGEVITQALPSTATGMLDGPAAAEVLRSLARFRALVVGPGLGMDPATVQTVRELVGEAEIPLVVDADGLNALEGHLELLRARRWPTVLTPHQGELARLRPRERERLADADPEESMPDRIEEARDLARRSGAVVLLKGSRTVIADPDGRVAVNLTGGSWLASAGTGDVLSGMIGALLGRGMPAWEAAVAGAWLHGCAAREAGRGRGVSGEPVGLVATDLIMALPRTLARLRNRKETCLVD